ncbi:hypothetical protein [Insolitispirillum peregrinum]|uniref:hypothetical protein n=1 Tax=Insolitispirillum peregrinum TaxID=80876 RepID=UPI00361112B9
MKQAICVTRFRTCLHHYVHSVPVGSFLSAVFIILFTGELLPIAAYILGCLGLFALFSADVQRNGDPLAGVKVLIRGRPYGFERGFSLFANASYPLTVLLPVISSLERSGLYPSAVSDLLVHIVLSCCIRDGFGTLMSIAQQQLAEEGDAA